jgi:thiosulfate reductase cytochrome b subunit
MASAPSFDHVIAAPGANTAAVSPRHPVFVRLTHWLTAFSFGALLVSGVAILLAHPRLYWGETGAFGGPALIDLPLPLVLTGQTGWGRSLHFLAAWLCVMTGLIYAAVGLATHHFGEALRRYTAVQRRAYLTVVFALFPLMIWTGLAMSPALAAVFPPIVTAFGGQQSARTIHFFVTGVLLLFVLAHVTMVWRAGFAGHVRAMTFSINRGARE